MTWPWQAVNPSSILPPKRWTAKGLAQLWLLQMAPEMPCSQILYHLFAGAVQMLDCSQYMLQAKQGDCKSIERRKKMPISLISISLIVCNVPELQALVDWGLLSITSFLNAKREAVLWTASATTASRTHTQLGAGRYHWPNLPVNMLNRLPCKPKVVWSETLSALRNSKSTLQNLEEALEAL